MQQATKGKGKERLLEEKANTYEPPFDPLMSAEEQEENNKRMDEVRQQAAAEGINKAQIAADAVYAQKLMQADWVEESRLPTTSQGSSSKSHSAQPALIELFSELQLSKTQPKMIGGKQNGESLIQQSPPQAPQIILPLRKQGEKNDMDILHEAILKRDFRKQAEIVCHLADNYLASKDFKKATALYNQALNLLAKTTDLPKKDLAAKKKSINIQIKATEEEFLSALNKTSPASNEDYRNSNHRSNLQAIRGMVSKELKEKELGALEIKSLYRIISKGIKGFVKGLLKEAKSILGDPPCKYAVLGLGSLSREEMTPYSDLEWAILIEDRSKEENAVNKEYFRNLTRLVELRVLNLGETPLSFLHLSKEEEMLSYLDFSKGFCFDSDAPDARKTPLGSPGKFELIGTPQELAAYINNFIIDRHLATVLLSHTLVEGENGLVQNFQKEIQKHLPDKERKKRALQLLVEDLARYEPTMGKELEHGKVFAIKYEFYRTFERVIDDLSLFSGLNFAASSTLQKIIALQEQRILGKEGASKLKVAFETILHLRLQEYMASGSQQETAILKAEVLWPIYATMKSLRTVAEQFWLKDGNYLLRKENFESQELDLVKGQVYETLKDLPKALFYYTRDIAGRGSDYYPYREEDYPQFLFELNAKNPLDPWMYANFTSSYILSNKYLHWEELFKAYRRQRNLDPLEHESGIARVPMPPSDAEAAIDRGNLCRSSHEYHEAEEAYGQAIHFAQKTRHLPTTKIRAYMLRGLSRYDQKKLPEAKQDYDRAFQLLQEKLGVGDNTCKENNILADYYHNLGLYFLHHSIRQSDEAIKCFEYALKIDEKMYGDYAMRCVETTRALIQAQALNMQDNIHRKLELKLQKAKVIISRHSPSSQEAAELTLQQGDLLMLKESFHHAIPIYQQALNMMTSILAEDSVEVALIYLQLAKAYHKCQNSQQARGHYERAHKVLSIDKHTKYHATLVEAEIMIYPEKAPNLILGKKQDPAWKDTPEYASLLNTLAFQYINKENYTQALGLLERAIEIAQKYRDDARLNTFYNNYGDIFFKTKNYVKAIQIFTYSIDIQRKHDYPRIMLFTTALLYRGLSYYQLRQQPGKLALARSDFEEVCKVLEPYQNEGAKHKEYIKMAKLSIKAIEGKATVEEILALQSPTASPMSGFAQTIREIETYYRY